MFFPFPFIRCASSSLPLFSFSSPSLSFVFFFRCILPPRTLPSSFALRSRHDLACAFPPQTSHPSNLRDSARMQLRPAQHNAEQDESVGRERRRAKPRNGRTVLFLLPFVLLLLFLSSPVKQKKKKEKQKSIALSSPHASTHPLTRSCPSGCISHGRCVFVVCRPLLFAVAERCFSAKATPFSPSQQQQTQTQGVRGQTEA